MVVGDNVRNRVESVRSNRGLSVAELARRIGVTRQTATQYQVAATRRAANTAASSHCFLLLTVSSIALVRVWAATSPPSAIASRNDDDRDATSKPSGACAAAAVADPNREQVPSRDRLAVPTTALLSRGKSVHPLARDWAQSASLLRSQRNERRMCRLRRQQRHSQ